MDPAPVEELSEIKLHSKLGKPFLFAETAFHDLSFKCSIGIGRLKDGDTPSFRSNTICPGMMKLNRPAMNSCSRLSTLSHQESQLHFLCTSEQEEANLHKRLIDAHITLPKNTHSHIGYLSSGLVIEDLNMLIFPLTELTHRYKMRRQKLRSTYHTSPQKFMIYSLVNWSSICIMALGATWD